MKILVAIANFGPYRFGYLDKVITTYQRHAPPSGPRHPFRSRQACAAGGPAHGRPADARPVLAALCPQRLFAERQDEYDLFIYTEDDILICEHNLAAFVEASAVLPHDEIPGLFRFERDEVGRVFFVDAHPPWDWVPGSVATHGCFTFATFSNAHSGCYVLTRSHLRGVIQSGGYLVPPHDGFNDIRASAATDPYTRCGLTRRLCVSHLDRFLIHHLPNNYIGILGTAEADFRARLPGLSRRDRRPIP